MFVFIQKQYPENFTFLILRILELFLDKREEKFLTGKPCLERKAATIIKLNADILETLDVENEIVQEMS